MSYESISYGSPIFEKAVPVSEPKFPNSDPFVLPQTSSTPTPKIVSGTSIGTWVVKNKYLILGTVLIAGSLLAYYHFTKDSDKE